MAPQTNSSIADITIVPQAAVDTESRAILDLEGMTCASCAMRIEKGLKKVPGVRDASVNLATEKATATYDPAVTGLEQMVQKVEAVGYKATPEVAPRVTVQRDTARSVDASLPKPTNDMLQRNEQGERKASEIRRKRNLLLLGIAFTLPVVVLSMFFVNYLRSETGGL